MEIKLPRPSPSEHASIMALNKIYTSKYLQITIHVLFWGLIIVSPYFFRNPTSWKGFTVWHYRGMVNTVLLAAFFYLNAYYVYPILYKKKKQLLLYILVMIGLLGASVWTWAAPNLRMTSATALCAASVARSCSHRVRLPSCSSSSNWWLRAKA